MIKSVILASKSEVRKNLLVRAGVDVVVHPVSIDEEAVRESLSEEGVCPRDMADHLAEMKAFRAAGSYMQQQLVLGCDQVLELNEVAIGKPRSLSEARSQLESLSGQKHKLHSAAVIYDREKPVWRHIGTTTLQMRTLTPEFIESYLERNWEKVRFSVGGYLIEDEGIRLFSRIDGSHFVILGLPLLEILSYLTLREILKT
jgi:septum formation protein